MNSLYRKILLFGFILLANSCYRDLSNYEYSEINEIIITPGTYNYTTPKEGMTAEVILNPVVTQTMTEGTDNLSYQWKRQTAAITWEVVGNEAEYVLEVTSSDVSTISFIFAVTDNNLGITTYAEIDVIPIFAFEQCWFLLQDIDGQAVLGSVDGEADSRVVTQDIYYQTTGNSLSGSPLFLGVHPFMRTSSLLSGTEDHEILLGVFTSSEQYILNGSTLDFHSTLYYNRILYGKKISGEAADPSLMKGQRRGFAIVDGGNMWYAVHDEFALMYKVRLDATLGDEYDYYAADLCVSYGRGNYALVYDSMGERFLFYNNGDLGTGYYERQTIVESGGTADDTYEAESNNNNYRLASLGQYSEDYPNNFDPDNIPTGFVIDDMSMCVGDLANNVLAIGHIGSSFYIYEICMDALTGTVTGMPYCNGYWNLAAEGDLSAYSTGKIPATTSDYFTRIFFYAAGTTIYKVDLNMETPRISAIWTADDANAVITGLKFKSDNEDIAYIEEGSTDDAYSRKGIIHQLGAVVQHQDGSCELVEFEITAAGEIEQDSAGTQNIKIFEGFTNVVDFVFSYREILL